MNEKVYDRYAIPKLSKSKGGKWLTYFKFYSSYDAGFEFAQNIRKAILNRINIIIRGIKKWYIHS